ncbi:beta-ketoacyl synthase chain length factor [Methylomonas rapida]|uniref:Beta-ketoacyl synthase chain length factor n=1 Tax=Methylomonas rapida TaxID=2963939 RepID=A0ABY7GPK1_9GAMM|nr:beta-ketoacyl synthase chain length factor [Methylomonas rapida]WAR46435.1 beta-ketoacyl synthase chain length factor [Methylomonas rapida]
MDCITLLGFAACTLDTEFKQNLPFSCVDNTPEAIPPLLRRRSSQAMQLAFSAANAACGQTGRTPAALPAIFASVAGEIRTTDQLCGELARADGSVSPSAFHNSVQNTVAGYWSIVHRCRQPATALAAGANTIAMALLEAWCQLACQGGELLLVCYDEDWPAHLAPDGGKPGFACAMVLAAGDAENGILRIGRPYPGANQPAAEWERMPVLAAIPLLTLAGSGQIPRETQVPLGREWWVIAHDCGKIA